MKQAPGAVFRSLLAGALLGGAIGSQGSAGGGSVGGFLGGFSKGGNAVQQQEYQRQQQAQQAANEQKKMGLEEQKFDEEKMQHKAALEQWNIENLMHGREADYRDREQFLKENEQDANVQEWAVENGAYLAPSVRNNGEPGNGQQLMEDMTRNPDRFNPPAGVGRLLVKHYDFDGLGHDTKNGWTEKDGSPVDWNKRIAWSVYYVPRSDSKPIAMSASEWTRLYGVQFPKGTDPNATFNVKAIAPLVGVATTNRKQTREDDNQDFKQQHDALASTIASSRTNVTQLESEKRELLRQGYSESDAEVKEIAGKIEAEQKRETDAIAEMHPRIRQRVTKQTQQTPTPKPAPSTPSSATPKKGDTQSHAGFDYTFDGTNWIKGKPTR